MPALALRLEPRQVLTPGDEVVHLLHVDAAEPARAGARTAPAPPPPSPPRSWSRRSRPRAGPRAPRRATAPPRRTSATSRSSRVPASSAAPTTSRASRASPPNVFHVPSPTTGPSRRSSISRRARARACPAAKAAAKNHGSSSRPATHVRERQPLARLSPAGDVDLVAAQRPAARRADSPPARRSRRSRPRSASTDARVMRDAAVPLARVAPPRSAARAPAAASPARPKQSPPPPVPPCPSRVPVPTIPGPIPTTTTSAPRARATASAEYTLTASTSPPKQAPAPIVELEQSGRCGAREGCPRAPAAARRPGAARTRRAARARAAQTGATWLCSEQPTTGRPSSVAGSSAVLLRRAAPRTGSACTAASSRAHPARTGSSSPRVRFACRTSNPPEPEPELARLDVDEHLVALVDGPGQLRVVDAGRIRRPRSGRGPRAARAPPSPCRA